MDHPRLTRVIRGKEKDHKVLIVGLLEGTYSIKLPIAAMPPKPNKDLEFALHGESALQGMELEP